MPGPGEGARGADAPPGWPGEVETESEKEIRALVRGLIAQGAPERTRVLEVLHGVQKALHHVPRAAAEEIERAMGIAVADVYGLVSFYDLLTLAPTGRSVLRICEDLSCALAGAEELARQAERLIGPEGEPTEDGAVSWTRCACLGLCEQAPAALFAERPLGRLAAAAIERIGAGDA